MSNGQVIASHYFKNSNEAGIVIVKDRGRYGVGNFQHIPGIGERYIIRKRFDTEPLARAAANRGWLAGHHDAI